MASLSNRNVMAAQMAKHLFGVPRVVSRIYDPIREVLYHELGLETISPTKVGATLLKEALAREPAASGGGDTASTASRAAIVGSPQTVAAQMREDMQLGFNEFVFQVGLPGTPEPYVRESLELLGRAVLPQFAPAAGLAAGAGGR